MKPRIDPQEMQRLDLRAHAILAGLPAHDAWAIDLPGGGPGRTIDDVRRLLHSDGIRKASRLVGALFRLRAVLGRLLDWDREPPGSHAESFMHRLTERDRAISLVPPGTPDGPFRLLYVFPRELLAEVRNATVHAFSLMVLVDHPGGYRLYWSVHVRPVGRPTSWYMRLIQPFRRWIVYPTLLRRLREAWASTDWMRQET